MNWAGQSRSQQARMATNMAEGRWGGWIRVLMQLLREGANWRMRGCFGGRAGSEPSRGSSVSTASAAAQQYLAGGNIMGDVHAVARCETSD